MEAYVTQSTSRVLQLDRLHNIAASSHSSWERGLNMSFHEWCFTNMPVAGLEVWEKKKLYKQLLVMVS